MQVRTPLALRDVDDHDAVPGHVIDITSLRPALEPPVPDARAATEGDLYTRDGAIIVGPDVPESRRDSSRRRALAAADVVGISLAWASMWIVAPPPFTLSQRLPLALALPLWILFHKLLGLYDRDDKLIHKSTLDELPKLLHSITLGTLLIFFVGPLVVGFELLRTGTFVFWALALVTVPASRATVRAMIRSRFAAERCLIVGTDAVARLVARKLAAHPEYGVEVVGFVDAAADSPELGWSLQTDVPRLGDTHDFVSVCRANNVERVIIAFSSLEHERLLDVIRASKRARLKISVVPRLFEVVGHQVVLDEVEGMTLLGLRGLARPRSSLRLKRVIDVAGAACGLIVLAPLLAMVALAVKLTSSGPIFYGQRRVGRRGEFRIWKFRSMVVEADAMKADLAHLNEADGIMFKISRDPRVTPVGRILRRTSLDELPQLWNVLRGEMSLVGPRPLVPDEDTHVLGWHRARLDLTPGLTGPWQVAGRTAIPFEEMVKMDYLYVAEWSLWNDIRLLLRTAPVVLFGRGH